MDDNPIPASLDEVFERLKRIFNIDVNPDVILRRFETRGGDPALLVYMSGMADDVKLNEFVLKPLFETKVTLTLDTLQNVVRIAEVRREKDLQKMLLSVMDGIAAVFLEGTGECLLLETHGYEKRGISSPENEKVVSGPKESFTESLRTNITLIRRQLHLTGLIVEQKKTCAANNTRYAIVYVDGLTDPKLVDEVRKRAAQANFSGVMSSGILEQLMEDGKLSPLPQILSTERPDRACSHVLNGRVCVLVEGSPFALVMPATFFSLMNSPEDVYMRMPLGTLIRVIRYFGALISVMLPGYFLALALYHQGLLSTEVLSTVIASRRMVFEPIGVEMLLLLLIFQMIREAGQRVPGNIGQAIGIIGGLIMGQAAVAAHLASSVVLIIVAASGLGNFCIPDYRTQLAASYFRVAVVLAAWMGGLLGIVAVTLAAVAHAASLESFGVPFLEPAAPKKKTKRGTVIRGRIG